MVFIIASLLFSNFAYADDSLQDSLEVLELLSTPNSDLLPKINPCRGPSQVGDTLETESIADLPPRKTKEELTDYTLQAKIAGLPLEHQVRIPDNHLIELTEKIKKEGMDFCKPVVSHLDLNTSSTVVGCFKKVGKIEANHIPSVDKQGVWGDKSYFDQSFCGAFVCGELSKNLDQGSPSKDSKKKSISTMTPAEVIIFMENLSLEKQSLKEIELALKEVISSSKLTVHSVATLFGTLNRINNNLSTKGKTIDIASYLDIIFEEENLRPYPSYISNLTVGHFCYIEEAWDKYGEKFYEFVKSEYLAECIIGNRINGQLWTGYNKLTLDDKMKLKFLARLLINEEGEQQKVFSDSKELLISSNVSQDAKQDFFDTIFSFPGYYRQATKEQSEFYFDYAFKNGLFKSTFIRNYLLFGERTEVSSHYMSSKVLSSTMPLTMDEYRTFYNSYSICRECFVDRILVDANDHPELATELDLVRFVAERFGKTDSRIEYLKKIFARFGLKKTDPNKVLQVFLDSIQPNHDITESQVDYLIFILQLEFVDASMLSGAIGLIVEKKINELSDSEKRLFHYLRDHKSLTNSERNMLDHIEGKDLKTVPLETF